MLKSSGIPFSLLLPVFALYWKLRIVEWLHKVFHMLQQMYKYSVTAVKVMLHVKRPKPSIVYLFVLALLVLKWLSRPAALLALVPLHRSTSKTYVENSPNLCPTMFSVIVTSL
jgi:hypothetical protein